MSERRMWEIMELKDGSMLIMAKIDPEAREALDALLEEDDWTDVNEAVSGALVALVEVRLAESETFAEKMAARSRAAGRVGRSVDEILLDYAAGRKDWKKTFVELVACPFTSDEDALWQEVRTAHSRGWISTAQYWQLSSRVLGQGPGVVLPDER